MKSQKSGQNSNANSTMLLGNRELLGKPSCEQAPEKRRCRQRFWNPVPVVTLKVLIPPGCTSGLAGQAALADHQME